MFQMYKLWGRRLKTLNRILKHWIAGEKENEKTEFYTDLIELRELVIPALRLYNQLIQQKFVRFTDDDGGGCKKI